MAGNEPDTSSGALGNRSGNHSTAGTTRRTGNAARIGAKVSVDGVKSLVAEFNKLLDVLRKVRTEMDAINGSGSSVGQGVGSQPHQQLQQMTSQFRNIGGGNINSNNTRRGLGDIGAGIVAISGITNRFNRNMQESVGISQNNALTASMYTGAAGYQSTEWSRISALGRFAGSRQDAQAAQNIALGYGLTAKNSTAFLGTVGNVVQASGGTLTAPQAAASAGSFLDPQTMRRGSAMGVQQAMKNGTITNPLTQGQNYIKNYEKRMGITLNLIDFANMRNPGDPTRYTFMRLYGLTDTAMDTIIQAGMQNLQFKGATGSNVGTGSDINFNKSSDLSKIGLSTNRLGLKAFELMTTSSKRDARFFQNQEGAMVGRMQSEENIQNTLSDVETAFKGLLDPLYRFGRYLEIAASALGAGGLMKLLNGGGGGGGGGIIGSVLGRIGGGGGAVAGAGAAAEGAGAAAGAAEVAGGVGLGGVAVGIGTAALTVAAPIAIAAGAVSFANSQHNKDMAKKQKIIAMESDSDLIKNLNNGTNKGANGGGETPGFTAHMDIFQRRRGALMAAMLSDARDAGDFNDLDPKLVDQFQTALAIFSGPKVTDNLLFNTARGISKQFIDVIKKTDKATYDKYFDIDNPFDTTRPVNTPEAQALITTKQDLWGGDQAAAAQSAWQQSSGDPQAGQAVLPGGSSTPKGESGDSWNKLDSRMKSRLDKMFRDSGGKVWLGGGWRSSDAQRAMFLSRYTEDPNGTVSWNGKKWKHTSGAPAAPPGSSNHEIGMAADLQGDLAWVQANASKYGLKTFASVNNEPWHVQLAELPNGFLGAQSSDSTGASTNTASTDTSAVSGSPTGAAGSTGGVGSSGGSAISGVNYSMASALADDLTSGSADGGTASSSTGSPNLATSGATGAGGSLAATDVAKMAYAAGFRGQDLIDIVAIAGRESHDVPTAHNTNSKTGDNSYGLTQINMIGALGPARLKMFGLSSNDQLLDPQTNLNAAYKLFQSAGGQLTAWGGYKGMSNTFGTDGAAATKAVHDAGLGDPMPSGGGGNTVVHVSQSFQVNSVNESYDARAMAAMSAKHTRDAIMEAKRNN